jgi:hypothetical protein
MAAILLENKPSSTGLNDRIAGAPLMRSTTLQLAEPVVIALFERWFAHALE